MLPRRHAVAIGPLKSALAAIAAATLSACADPASLALGGVSIVTFAQTGKTVTDHAMSLATDQDCALKHSLNGQPWCLPAQGAVASNPEPVADQYCYQSIAAVTCYRRQNRHDTASRRTEPPLSGRNAELATSPETGGK